MKIEKDLLFYFYAIGYTRSSLAKQSGKKLAELSQAIRAALQARATCSFYGALRPDSDTIRKELFSRRLLAMVGADRRRLLRALAETEGYELSKKPR